MSYRGDIRLGDTIDVKFSTVGTTGAPTTLAGSPAVSAYVGNSTTEITAGITLTVDFDARTGLHNVRVVASSGNGFATQTNIDLVLTAGTVGGTSVVGYVIGSFSIENRLVDANVVRLLGTAWLAPGTAGTPDVNMKLVNGQTASAAAPVTFPGTIASTTNIAAGTITNVGTLTTYTGNTPQTGDSFARIGAAGAGLTGVTGATLSSAYDFAKGTVAMTESFAANGVAPTPVQAMYAIHQMLMQFAISSTTYTVKKLNNTDTAFIVTLDSATTPTSAVRT